jgi:hypothetical protein
VPGYANRRIMLDFPELSEPDDKVHIIIRDPKMMTLNELTPDLPEGAETDRAASTRAMMDVFARMVIAWHVYDATSLDDEQPPLDLPATGDKVARLPLLIQNRLADELAKVRAGTSSPADAAPEA